MVYPENCVLYIFGFQVVVLLPLLVFDEHVSHTVAESKNRAYLAGIHDQLLSGLEVFRYVFSGFITGLLTFFVTFTTFDRVIVEYGFTEDANLIVLYVFIVYTLTLQVVTLLETWKISKYIVFSHVFLYLALIFYLLITNYNASSPLYSATGVFFSNPLLVLACITNAGMTSTLFYGSKL